MIKTLFLEYKLRDFTDDELCLPRSTDVMAAFEKLNESRIKQIRRLKLGFGISFVATNPEGGCPLSPESISNCRKNLDKIIKLKPDLIWFDYLMFPGKWNVQKSGSWKGNIHDDCEYCYGKDRQKEIYKLAKSLLGKIPKQIKCGYFSMPFREGELNNWNVKLGQDNKLLGSIFDFISPMLYHRMIDKKTAYIHEHVSYLKNLGIYAKILPIVQIKDMPDEIDDGLTLDEIKDGIENAVKPPSSGVALFSWDQAIEKNKLSRVGELLRDIK